MAEILDVEDLRRRVERAEKWQELCSAMPYLRFPPDWEVAIIPPFAGAVARFWVRKGEAHVSVYADFYERLGCWSEPHWEIYPNEHDDNERFPIATETDAMMAAIGRSLAAIADTHPKDGDVKQAPLVSGGGAKQSPKGN